MSRNKTLLLMLGFLIALSLIVLLLYGLLKRESLATYDTDSGEIIEEDKETGVNNSISRENNNNDPEVVEANKTEELIDEWIFTHTLEEKVAQMFMVTPEELTGYETVTVAGEATAKSINQYPVGGIIYFSKNLISREQTLSMLKNTKQYYSDINMPIPFLATDEEGGRVARVANNSAFGVPYVSAMGVVGDNGDLSEAAKVGATIGRYLSDLGFNMDMAPVADVLTNPSNTVIGDRSFGDDPSLVSSMVIAESDAMRLHGVIPVIKHYPGHGATTDDSHEGYVYTNKTIEELLECELIPFLDASENGIEAIMVGHISVPSVTGSNEPSSESYVMITEILRNKLGFDGVVITDSMSMGAISQMYSSSEAAIGAIKAGADIILIPADFESAYNGVLEAVDSGDLSDERINQSVRWILRLKTTIGEEL